MSLACFVIWCLAAHAHLDLFTLQIPASTRPAPAATFQSWYRLLLVSSPVRLVSCSSRLLLVPSPARPVSCSSRLLLVSSPARLVSCPVLVSGWSSAPHSGLRLLRLPWHRIRSYPRPGPVLPASTCTRLARFPFLCLPVNYHYCK
ncbi:hypothetical protein NQD34_004869 [Periophthalmus magnuspinnatus]|nr:hypothetical protein NQD34_004869 [Periophthalmus magnuspinnatus]